MKAITKSIIIMFVIVFLVNTITNAQDTIINKTAIIKIQTSAICGSCKARIEKNMAFEKGVIDVVLDLETKIATITYKTSKTSPDALRLAMSKIGYDADNIPADPVAYEKLPACCKKGAEPHQ